MKRKLANTASMLLIAMAVVLLIACSQETSQTEADSKAAGDEQATAESVRASEEELDKEPASTPTIEPSGLWNIYEEVTGGIKIWDGVTREELDFDEIDLVYELMDVEEYDNYHGNHDVPSGLHVELANGTKGDIANADAVADLWERILRMRISPDLVATDPGTFESNEFVFSWEDGREQTYTFEGRTALAVDGMLYPILEGDIISGEVFNGPIASRPKNERYPDTVYDIARMMVDDGLGKREVIIVKSGSSWFQYTEDSFTWDDGEGVWGTPTYTVKHVQQTGDTPGGMLIGKNLDSSEDAKSCLIEGAERIFVIDKVHEDGEYYLEVTYQPEGTKDRAQCTIRMTEGELAVSPLDLDA